MLPKAIMNGNCELHSEHRVEGQDGNAWESVENWQTLATRMHSTAPQPAQLSVHICRKGLHPCCIQLAPCLGQV